MTIMKLLWLLKSRRTTTNNHAKSNGRLLFFFLSLFQLIFQGTSFDKSKELTESKYSCSVNFFVSFFPLGWLSAFLVVRKQIASAAAIKQGANELAKTKKCGRERSKEISERQAVLNRKMPLNVDQLIRLD